MACLQATCARLSTPYPAGRLQVPGLPRPAGLGAPGPAFRPQRTPSFSDRRTSRRGALRRAAQAGSGLPPPPPPPARLWAAGGPTAWEKLQQLGPRIGGAALLAAALLLPAGAAEAARSGGRMGGAAFGGSRFGGGFGTGTAAASSAFRGGSPSISGRGYASSYSPRPLSGGFSSPLSPSTGSVRAQSFFLSPFGGGDPYSYGGGNTEGYEEVVTVAKVQVGLIGSARELQRDLERIADRADTDSPAGLHYILQETVLSLMRNPEYCLYGFAKSKRETCAEDAETAFNQLSLQERGKFQKETRVNVGGMNRRSSLGESKPYADGDKELIVITILLAADGSFKLPAVNSWTDLKQALSMLGAVRADDLLAVEVLWTPEEEGDHYTVEDLALDYPSLFQL